MAWSPSAVDLGAHDSGVIDCRGSACLEQLVSLPRGLNEIGSFIFVIRTYNGSGLRQI